MTMYVDGAIGVQSCADYAPLLRSCCSGSATAYASLDSAATAAQAGDTVFIRQGGLANSFCHTIRVVLATCPTGFAMIFRVFLPCIAI